MGFMFFTFSPYDSDVVASSFEFRHFHCCKWGACQKKSSQKCTSIILNPSNPTFIVKLEFTGVNFIFLISAQNIDYGYSFQPPQQSGSNGTTIYVLSRNMKN